MFVKLKEGVDHSNTSQLSGSPYTPQHVKHYFSKYLAQEGVLCTQQLQKVFDECYNRPQFLLVSNHYKMHNKEKATAAAV